MIFYTYLQSFKYFTFAILAKSWRPLGRVRINNSVVVLEHLKTWRLHLRNRGKRATLVLEHQKVSSDFIVSIYRYEIFHLFCLTLVLLLPYTDQEQILMNLHLLTLSRKPKGKRSILKRLQPFLWFHLTALQWAQEAKGWIRLALQ